VSASPRNAVAFLTSFTVFEGKGYFALCGGRLRGFAPKTPTKGDTVPFGNPLLLTGIYFLKTLTSA